MSCGEPDRNTLKSGMIAFMFKLANKIEKSA